MIRKDWLERQVKMLAQALRAVLGLKTKGDIETAASAIEAAVHKLSGLSPRLALGLPLKEFLALTFRGEEPPSEVLAVLSKIFGEWAAMLKAQGKESEAAAARQRAQELARPAGPDVHARETDTP